MNQTLFSATWRFTVLLIAALRFVPFHSIVPTTQAQGIVFNQVTPSQTTVAKWDKYEAIIDLTASYTNPYDYNDIAVQAVFTSPSGVQHTVDAFWMQDYSIDSTTRNLVPLNDSGFHIRFTPNETGAWSYTLSGRLQNGSPVAAPATYHFTCSGVSATGRGYIRKTNTHYLTWDNGAPYIPVGENIPYPYSNIIKDYEGYLDKTDSAGMNFIRVWMATWGFALEWTNTAKVSGFHGLKQYKQPAAKALDYLLDRGQANGYAVMLCINYHNQILTDTTRGPEWKDNPYNSSRGGPCANPWDFFTNSTAKSIFKNRLRYLVARWGYSGSLQSWELFNEADNWDYYSTNILQVDQWHHEMAGYLHSIDANHLVTTSFGDEKNGNGTWNSAYIDFTQIHKYSADERLPRLLSDLHDQRLATYAKPVMTGEFGLSVYEEDPLFDPNGISLHNVMWATLFSGSMGSAVPWLWNNWVHAKDLYDHFASLSAFKDLVPFEAGNFRKVTPTYSSTGTAYATIIPQAQWGDTTVGTDFTLDNEGELTPGTDSLLVFLYGSDFNQYRRPPTFHVNYLQQGSFVVVTDTVQASARISIYVDGVLQLDQPAQVRTTYPVNVPAGPHTIQVDNSGFQWAIVAQYRFVNAVGPFNIYVLKSADNKQAAGYVLQRLYTYKYLSDNQTAPPAVPAGTLLQVPGMQDGAYTVNLYSCAAASTTATPQPVGTVTATASNGTLTFTLPEVTWDIAFTATMSSTDAISAPVSVTPQAGWGATTAASFTVSGNGTLTPGASSLGMFIYGSEANTQYRNPPSFAVNYAQAGYFEVRTAATISIGWPRVTIYVDGVKMLDQPAFINTSYVVTILPGPHTIKVDNLGGDWTQVDHYSFVPSLASPPPAPAVTANARTVTPGYPWGSMPPYNTFTLSDNGTLTPAASNLGMYVYGSQAHPDKRNPATINVTFPQAGYLRVNTGGSVSQGGASRVSIYVDGVLVTDQMAFPNLPYIIAVTAGTHNIKIDNLGGDWFLADTFVFDVLEP